MKPSVTFQLLFALVFCLVILNSQANGYNALARLYLEKQRRYGQCDQSYLRNQACSVDNDCLAHCVVSYCEAAVGFCDIISW
ncbi:hypothetical protein TrispH2_011556 [Trichoplax sp. H2]|nr:hypothetical protein TrispH2_011556 [Trichoplax sp. H2]|eukprot:RDD36642.1 hypothetical protein TrispH2_011556 [Trichoplax sp. H2]